MKSELKPANAKARALLKKLEALAEKGIDGEKASARRKLARLKARFDFTAPEPAETLDLFRGTFRRSTTGRRIGTFPRSEFDLANSVKWAIESATRIRCLYRDDELLAEATPTTARRLEEIAIHISQSFRTLLDQFSAVSGLTLTHRAAFVMGLYDGMMNEARGAGQPLPGHSVPRKASRRKKTQSTNVSTPDIHPYSVALGLGKQIRSCAPLEQIAAELKGVTVQCLGAG